MKRIPLTHGLFALVDDEDYDHLTQWYWSTVLSYTGGPAATRCRVKVDGPGPSNISMHRVIVGATPGQSVNHRDRDNLNNQRYNLRHCTFEQCRFNRKPHVGCTSRFKGIHWNKRWKKWQVRITYQGERTHLGGFNDEEEAARAYDKAALEMFDDYAYLNFPPEEVSA